MSKWKTIKTAPTKESYGPFLVLLPENSEGERVIVQVSVFEGRMYPDYLASMVDWGDAVTNAAYWMPRPYLPGDAR